MVVHNTLVMFVNNYVKIIVLQGLKETVEMAHNTQKVLYVCYKMSNRDYKISTNTVLYMYCKRFYKDLKIAHETL